MYMQLGVIIRLTNNLIRPDNNVLEIKLSMNGALIGKKGIESRT
jgi:hypothetical protein